MNGDNIGFAAECGICLGAAGPLDNAGKRGDAGRLAESGRQGREDRTEAAGPFCEWVLRACDDLQLPQEIKRAFHEALERIRRDERLFSVMADAHCRLFRDGANDPEWFATIAEQEQAMGPSAGMFVPVLVVSGYPHTLRRYAERGISRETLLDTLSDLELWMRHYKAEKGVWGTDQLRWLLRHFRGDIFRLGRLQFHFNSFWSPVKVYRHRTSGETIALFEEGVRLRADGLVDGTNGVFDTAGGRTTRFVVHADGTVEGTMISPDGYARDEAVRLSPQDWKLVLARGDRVLHVHIPAGRKLDPEACLDSYRQAKAFFARHFPESDFAGFATSTWLLGPMWRNLLPPESNIVKFQRRFYLIPERSDDFQTFERVFGAKPADFAKAPRDTNLRRIILDFVSSGGDVHGGAGFILKEDV